MQDLKKIREELKKKITKEYKSQSRYHISRYRLNKMLDQAFDKVESAFSQKPEPKICYKCSGDLTMCCRLCELHSEAQFRKEIRRLKSLLGGKE